MISSRDSKISLRRAISFKSASYSSSILSRSRPVRVERRMASMASAWISENEYFSISLSFASSLDLDDLINVTMSSMFDSAMRRPSKMCARASAFRSSNSVLLVMTIIRWSMKYAMISFNARTRGLLSTSARLMIP